MASLESSILLGSKVNSTWALPSIPPSPGTMTHSATLSLHSADKTLIEFLNAKGLGCKISSSDSLSRRDRGGFSGVLSAKCVLLC